MNKVTVGTVVRIRNDKYNTIPSALIGTVKAVNPNWSYPIAVEINEFRNTKSTSGYFYFDTDSVSNDLDVDSMYPNTLLQYSRADVETTKQLFNKLYGKKERENKMKNKHLIKGYNTVIIKFADSVNEYGIPTIDYDNQGFAYALYDESILIGDFVLCRNEHDVQVIGQITKIFYSDAEVEVRHGREVICKIDYSKYVERQERLKKIEKLKTAMAKKKEELNELAVYQALAATSPEMAEMLKELKELM